MYLLSRRPHVAVAFALAALVGLAPANAPQTMAASEILAASIAFHDPQGLWDDGSFRIELIQTRPQRGWTGGGG